MPDKSVELADSSFVGGRESGIGRTAYQRSIGEPDFQYGICRRRQLRVRGSLYLGQRCGPGRNNDGQDDPANPTPEEIAFTDR